ncbi:hypothetical protein FACS189449_02140 [Alphaproteobacteria bacterium]|nr:hypothetical protein FACS189449_02140 [Alphaproteobacteria bacterium]
MKRNNKLIFAWCAFGLCIATFLVVTGIYHDDHSEQSPGYQYRILINKDVLSTAEEDNSDKEKPADVPEKSPDPGVGKSPDSEKLSKNDDNLFYEKAKYGYLPKISPDGDKIFDVYSAKFSENGKKKACLVIYLDNSSIEFLDHALKILGTHTCTFIVPHYLDKITDVVKTISEAGHEIFMQIPIQSSTLDNSKNEIAPFLANSSSEDTLDTLLRLLSVSKYIIGIANTSPTLLTKSKNDMSVIVDELSKRGLAFLDLEKTNDIPQGPSGDDGVIHANASVVFDSRSVMEISDNDEGKIFSLHLDKLRDFLAAVSKHDNYVVAPISSLVRKK